MFQNQYASSLALRHLFNEGVEMRLSYGTSYRTPNFTELYSKQIFDGHFFQVMKNCFQKPVLPMKLV
ncbi:TonB-dependent receptor [Flavobacterium davisii]|uniref:TonB-dependent receptor n=1 Tax=Flavobacterium columnare TaxID=996 RepID=A0A8G0KUB0_9FLAO|nr:TonB-dependent receptor [Flavobacterium davisii]